MDVTNKVWSLISHTNRYYHAATVLKRVTHNLSIRSVATERNFMISFRNRTVIVILISFFVRSFSLLYPFLTLNCSLLTLFYYIFPTFFFTIYLLFPKFLF